jgi:hypothetical protein
MRMSMSIPDKQVEKNHASKCTEELSMGKLIQCCLSMKLSWSARNQAGE